MRTIFSMGFASKDLFGAMNPFMGQAEGPLSVVDRNGLLQILGAAADKYAVVSAWIDSHPNKAADLGADFQNFQNFLANAGTFSQPAAAVMQRIASDDSANWVVSSTEWNASSNWATTVDQLYDIISRHSAITPAGTPSGVNPGGAGVPLPSGAIGPKTAAAASSGPSPLVIGGAALAAVGLIALIIHA